jgi:hypothetical protein
MSSNDPYASMAGAAYAPDRGVAKCREKCRGKLSRMR